MPISLRIALRVDTLNRQGLMVAAIVRTLGVPEGEVMEAHRMLLLAENDTQETVAHRTEAQREAALDRMPKRMQDRIRRSRG